MKKKLIGAAASLALVGGMWLGGAGTAEAQSRNTPLCLNGDQVGVTYQQQAPGKLGATRVVREPIQNHELQTYFRHGYRYEITHGVDGYTQVWEEFRMPLPGGETRYRSTMLECTQEDRDYDDAIEVNPAPVGGGGAGRGGAGALGHGPTVVWSPSNVRTGTVTVGEVENV